MHVVTVGLLAAASLIVLWFLGVKLGMWRFVGHSLVNRTFYASAGPILAVAYLWFAAAAVIDLPAASSPARTASTAGQSLSPFLVFVLTTTAAWVFLRTGRPRWLVRGVLAFTASLTTGRSFMQVYRRYDAARTLEDLTPPTGPAARRG